MGAMKVMQVLVAIRSYIFDRSASTIDYVIADEEFAKFNFEFKAKDRLESMHTPLSLQFIYHFGKKNDETIQH